MAAHKERNREAGNSFGIDIRRPPQKSCALKVGGRGVNDVVAIIQRPRGNNKGGTFTDKSPTLSANGWEQNNILCISSKQAHATVAVNKSTPLVAAMGMGGGHVPMIARDEIVRRITPTEAARLQTIPEWHKWECSATQQYTMLGNGWTVEVIKHIFSFLQL